MLVVLQDFPDPDALASAAAMRALAHAVSGAATTVASSGVIGRAENRALARYLHLPHRAVTELTLSRFDLVALLDTQPGTGNNSLPPGFQPQIVIDHHPLRGNTRAVPFFDVRQRYGATATILYEYLLEARIALERRLATALTYGIRSDTHDLGREACQADVAAMIELYPATNHRVLSEIQHSPIARSYFRVVARALADARCAGDTVVASAGVVTEPDLVGEIADLLLRDEQSTWVLCLGAFEGQLQLSLRTRDPHADAGRVMRRLVKGRGTGGGHRAMAGGQISLAGAGDRAALEGALRSQLLRILRRRGRGWQRLV